MALRDPEPGTYLPEIHDLAPHVAPDLDRMIGAFPDAARDCLACLIVPNWQGREPLDADPVFAARLARLPGTPVLHGWTHSAGRDAWNALVYGQDNRSEFARLGAEETSERLRRGLEMLGRVRGRAPAWFCAPRWQVNRHLAPALAAAGISGNMLAATLHGPGSDAVRMPALNFDEGARALLNRTAIALRAPRIRRLLATRRPFRLVLHPDDLRRPTVFAQFQSLARRLEDEGWRPVALEDLFGQGQRKVQGRGSA